VKIPSIIPALALALALLSFPVWQQIFTSPNLPIQAQIIASDAGTVKAYWENPIGNPTAYEEIPVKPVQIPAGEIASNIWRVKVEALAEKEPKAKSAEIWLVDIRTPEHQVNWSEVNMGAKKWTLLKNPYGPQGKIAVARAKQPQSLEAVVKGSNLTIILLRSVWIGKVRVTANGQVRETSLYSANSAVEKLSFESKEIEAKRTKTYELQVVKTPWHRLKFVSDSDGVKVKSIKIGSQTILPDSNGEFILPFYFWNQFNCAIAATILSFLGLTISFTSIERIRRRDPQFLRWQWFAHDRVPKAMLKVRVANQELSVLPYQAFKYFLFSLVVWVMGLSLVEGYFYYQETYQIASLAALTAAPSQIEKAVWGMPQLASQEWMLEDERINRNNTKKILTSGSLFNPAEGDWVWRSAGFPVSQLSTKPNRILVMGDSYAWGHGYANMNDIWWRQLQRELTRRGYEQVEVIAAGLSGASTHQELEQARRLIKTYQPNLIIWGFVANDPDEGVVEQLDFKFVNQNSLIKLIKTLRNKGIFPRLNARLSFAYARKLTRTMSLKEYYREYGEWMLKLLKGKNFELYRETVQELDRLQSDSNIPGFLITLSVRGQAYNTYLKSKIVPLLTKGKTAFYNTDEEFLKFSSRLTSDPTYAKSDPVHMWRINPANAHPGAILTHFSAVQAADILEAHYPQILGKRNLSAKPPALHINDWVPYDLNPSTTASGVFSFNYPASEESMLRLPVNRPFVQLNLEFPVPLKEIRLSGSGLKSAALDLTAVDSKRQFDDGKVYSFDQKQGTALIWNLERQAAAKTVNTIRLSATFQNQNKQLTLTLIPANAGGQP